MAWIIGWDLILEYAVGNVAVAISWGDYFKTLVRGVGVDAAGVADDRLPHGAAQLEPATSTACCRRRRTIAGIPILVNLPAFGIVHADHVAAAARRHARARAPTTSWW